MTLADEANRYIDERKPWVIAKQDGADAELQAVCTQGLNLFRVLASALAPVLPAMARDIEQFLDAPLAAWGDVRSEEHTSELQSLMRNSYAVFCLKKKKKKTT